MSPKATDKTYMQRALDLAQLGRGRVSPNPMVGCVIVKDGVIIGEGYHQNYGGPHAEVHAVRSVGDSEKLVGSTVYVTLEPCSHYGKTPPCADLLIEMKVGRVVIGSNDPYEEVNGRGVRKLESAGIEVLQGVMENKCNALNKRFFTFHQKKRPYVILKWAQTADGFLARANFDSKWISNSYSRQLVHKWRAEEDAILVGRNTAFHDNPSLTVRDWHGRQPTRILIDAQNKIDPSFQLFNEQATTIVVNEEKEKQSNNIQWVQFQKGQLSPEVLLDILYQHKIQSVIIEGGANTLSQFIETGKWDEARVFESTSTFGSGISAPNLEEELVDEKDLLGDRLLIYRAPKNN